MPPAKPRGEHGPGDLAVELIALDKLKLDPHNANTHDATSIDAIKAALRQHGQRKPVVVSKNRTLVAGNGTVTAARELGWPEVWATIYPGTPAEARAYAIADNKTARFATWDDQQLHDTLADLQAKDTGLFLSTAFDDHGLHALAAKLDAGPSVADAAGAGRGTHEVRFTAADADPEAEEAAIEQTARYAERVKHPRTHEGDLWALGSHRLICGDSFAPETLEALLGTERRVDAVLTDPPYAIYGSSTGIGADIADDRMVRPFFEALMRILAARTKVFGHVYVHCDWRSWPALAGGARVAGLSVKNMIVWDKIGGLGNMYAQTHELVAFLVPEPPPRSLSSGRKTGHRQILRPNLVRYPRVSSKERQHNAAKPVPLLTELLGNSTDEGQLVLDLFSGSGSTLMACEQTGRIAMCSEQDPRWCDVIAARWQLATGRLPVLHRGDEDAREVDLTTPLKRPEK